MKQKDTASKIFSASTDLGDCYLFIFWQVRFIFKLGDYTVYWEYYKLIVFVVLKFSFLFFLVLPFFMIMNVIQSSKFLI